MLKKTVNYTDYFGEERTKDLYFNLSKAELAEMSVGDDSIQDQISKMVDGQDGKKILEFFRNFILKAYGERSEDGERFIKSEEVSKHFSQTAAFDKLLGDLVTYEEDPVEFMKALLPADIAKAAQEHMDEQNGLPQDFKKKS